MSHPTHPAPSLELRRVTAGYSTGRPPVLDDVSLVVPSRGTTRVTGPNGAGKSTVLELASGYLRAWSGAVLVAGTDASDPAARPLRRTCRTTPALYPQLTVAEHLELAATARSVDVEEGHERAASYGLGPWLDREAHELSTGNTRKLWFVVCTLGPFAVALLDEPFNGLDDETTSVMADEITRWSSQAAVLVVAHQAPPELVVDSEVALGPSVPLRPTAVTVGR